MTGARVFSSTLSGQLLSPPTKRYTMPQDSGARLKSKRKATLKLNKRAAAAAAKGEKPKGKPAKKKA